MQLTLVQEVGQPQEPSNLLIDFLDKSKCVGSTKSMVLFNFISLFSVFISKIVNALMTVLIFKVSMNLISSSNRKSSRSNSTSCKNTTGDALDSVEIK